MVLSHVKPGVSEHGELSECSGMFWNVLPILGQFLAHPQIIRCWSK